MWEAPSARPFTPYRCAVFCYYKVRSDNFYNSLI